MAVFKDFFVSSKFVKSINSTFIMMVPKKEGEDDFKDFRPISLVGESLQTDSKGFSKQIEKGDELVGQQSPKCFCGRQTNLGCLSNSK